MLQKISYLRREPVGATTAVGVWEHTETRTTRTTSNSNLYENVKATASNLMREQASWKTALRILEEKANRSVQLNYKQEDALQELRMQRVSLITQLENQKAEYQRLKFDLVEIIGQCSTFKASFDDGKSDRSRLQEIHEQLSQEITSVAEETETRRCAYEVLKRTLEQREKELESATEQVHAQADQLRLSKQNERDGLLQLQALAKEAARCRSLLEACNASRDELEQGFDSELALLAEVQAERHKQMASLMALIQLAVAQRDGQAQSAARMRTTTEQLQAQVVRLEEENERITRSWTELTMENESLAVEKDELAKTHGLQEERLRRDHHDRLAALQAELLALNAGLQQEAVELSQSLHAATATLAETAAANRQLRSQVGALQEEAQALRLRLEAAELNRTEGRAAEEALRQQLEERASGAEQARKALEERCHSLEERVQGLASTTGELEAQMSEQEAARKHHAKQELQCQIDNIRSEFRAELSKQTATLQTLLDASQATIRGLETELQVAKSAKPRPTPAPEAMEALEKTHRQAMEAQQKVHRQQIERLERQMASANESKQQQQQASLPISNVTQAAETPAHVRSTAAGITPSRMMMTAPPWQSPVCAVGEEKLAPGSVGDIRPKVIRRFSRRGGPTLSKPDGDSLEQVPPARSSLAAGKLGLLEDAGSSMEKKRASEGHAAAQRSVPTSKRPRGKSPPTKVTPASPRKALFPVMRATQQLAGSV